MRDIRSLQHCVVLSGLTDVSIQMVTSRVNTQFTGVRETMRL